MRNGLFMLIATSMVGVGCTSIQSTMLHQSGHNSPWEKEKCLKGVPITLSVLTHVRLTVVEKHFIAKKAVGGIEEYERVKLDVVLRDVVPEYIRTDKIFTVDFKKPAAGTFKNTIEFNANQYFTKITEDLDDQTLQRINDILGTVLSAVRGKQAAGIRGGAAGTAIVDNLLEVDSVVATGVFEVSDPEFEQKVNAFLECHVNKGNSGVVVPPGVVQKTFLTPLDNCGTPGCSLGGTSTPVFGHPTVELNVTPSGSVNGLKKSIGSPVAAEYR
jgi:hypothetical protein